MIIVVRFVVISIDLVVSVVLVLVHVILSDLSRILDAVRICCHRPFNSSCTMAGIVGLDSTISKDRSMTALISGLIISLVVFIAHVMALYRLSLLLIGSSGKW